MFCKKKKKGSCILAFYVQTKQKYRNTLLHSLPKTFKITSFDTAFVSIAPKQKKKKLLELCFLFQNTVTFEEEDQYSRLVQYTKRWKYPLRGISILQTFNISFLLLSLLFLIILFNFCLIQFIFYFVDYFIYTNHFIIFYILMGGLMWTMVEMHKDPWYAMGSSCKTIRL